MSNKKIVGMKKLINIIMIIALISCSRYGENIFMDDVTTSTELAGLKGSPYQLEDPENEPGHGGFTLMINSFSGSYYFYSTKHITYQGEYTPETLNTKSFKVQVYHDPNFPNIEYRIRKVNVIDKGNKQYEVGIDIVETIYQENVGFDQIAHFTNILFTVTLDIKIVNNAIIVTGTDNYPS